MRIIQKFFRESFVLFLAGVVLSAAIDVMLGRIVQRYVGVLLVFVSVFILYTVVTMGEMRKRIDGQLDRLELTAVWIHKPEEVYQRGAEIIRSAQNSILAINPYALGTPVLIMPKERPSYLEAIEQVIKRHLDESSSSSFVYTRVLQAEKASQVEGRLGRDLLNEQPPQSFDHCKRVFSMVKGKPNGRVEVMLYASEPLLSAPSMLIVDDKYVALAMLAPRQKLGEAEHSLELMGALFIEDRTGQRILDFKRIFEKVCQNSHRIYLVED